MALVTEQELRDALGIGDLYDSALLQECCDTATNLVDGMLTHHRAPITYVRLSGNIATATTLFEHNFVAGQTVIVADCGSPFNGTNVITATTALTFSWSETNADITERAIIPSGMATIQYDVDYSTDADARNAALIVAEEVFIARQSPFGGSQAVDYTPGPFKMGASLISRIQGLISRNRDVRGLIG
jgi:hypothetical protein